jgi:hypothetical protein
MLFPWGLSHLTAFLVLTWTIAIFLSKHLSLVVTVSCVLLRWLPHPWRWTSCQRLHNNYVLLLLFAIFCHFWPARVPCSKTVVQPSKEVTFGELVAIAVNVPSLSHPIGLAYGFHIKSVYSAIVVTESKARLQYTDCCWRSQCPILVAPHDGTLQLHPQLKL